MKSWLLDTSALLTLRDDEPGADDVAELLAQAQAGRARVFGCFITQMELFYRVWKDEGEGEGRLAYQQALSLPMTWTHESRELLERASAIKASYPLSLADAWIVAAADLAGATLVHKDPELLPLDLNQKVLPLKRSGRSST